MRKVPLKRAVALVTGTLGFLLAVYVFMLYRQLETTFDQRDQSLPTRIYSDINRLAPPMPRSTVEERLKSLGYTTEATTEIKPEEIRFVPHNHDFPAYLIPDGHPSGQAAGKVVTLRFDDPGPLGLLQSVSLEDAEVPEILLEPELLATLSRDPDRKEIRSLISFEDIPHTVKAAVMAVEDPHFMDHQGIDPRGIARAIWVNLRSGKLKQGGSTITQQLIKNLMARRTKNLFQKMNELFLALILELKYDKRVILERYLNEVYLGQAGSLEVHGVSEGARLFFGKKVDELTLGETALMAGLIRGPIYYSPYRQPERALERQRWVLKRMAETGFIAEAEVEPASKQAIRLEPPQNTSNKAPYAVDFVKAELIKSLKDRFTEEEIFGKGLHVYTTLDAAINAAGTRAVGQGIAQLEKRLKISADDRLEGALAAVEQHSGFLRALVGGRNYAKSSFNRILNMRRQVGSTFKPIVYLAALEKGVDPAGVPYGPAKPIEDSPWKLIYDGGRQSWTPKNYETSYMGWIDFRTALAHSINTVAAKLGAELGFETIQTTSRSLGMESELPRVPSLALGVAELTPVELLRAYAIMANQGVLDDLTAIRAIVENNGTTLKRWVAEPQQRISQGSADLITHMMESVFLDGTAKDAQKMGWERASAGKTGTTSNHRDAWFAGYSTELTTVVWVGTDQATPQTPKGKAKIKLTGAGAALPIWVDFMKEAHSGVAPAPFPESPQLSDLRMDRRSGLRATFGCPDSQVRVEKYITDRTPGTTACASAYPPSETVTHSP